MTIEQVKELCNESFEELIATGKLDGDEKAIITLLEGKFYKKLNERGKKSWKIEF